MSESECIEIHWYLVYPDVKCGTLVYVVSCVDVVTVGQDAVIKLVDRETLMKEREERLKVILAGNIIINLSFMKLLKSYCCLILLLLNNIYSSLKQVHKLTG